MTEHPRTAAEHPPDDHEQIRHFLLDGVLPAGHLVALNTALGTLSWLTGVNGGGRLLGEEQFTRTEMALLAPILAAYPDYRPLLLRL